MKALDASNVVNIDGSFGEGGGQIFRSTLSLAMCLGQSVKIDNIRAGRKKPGLLRQHLTCLRAAKEVCDAKVTGDELGSSSVTFEPSSIKAGEYHFSVGSAGSSTLVFQTVLLPLLFANEPSDLLLEGGTHNGMAPSVDFITRCFLPQLEKMGFNVDAELTQYGFYPAGGGAWKVRIHPVDVINRLQLRERGNRIKETAVAMSSRIPGHVTERELNQVKRKCQWSDASLVQKLVKSVGPGNILSLQIETENVTEVFESIGERNVSAEQVAGRAIRDLKRYLDTDVPVAEHLADQLLLPMALGKGGVFRTLKPSLHLLTNIDVIKKMTGIEIVLKEISEDCWEVIVDI